MIRSMCSEGVILSPTRVVCIAIQPSITYICHLNTQTLVREDQFDEK